MTDPNKNFFINGTSTHMLQFCSVRKRFSCCRKESLPTWIGEKLRKSRTGKFRSYSLTPIDKVFDKLLPMKFFQMGLEQEDDKVGNYQTFKAPSELGRERFFSFAVNHKSFTLLSPLSSLRIKLLWLKSEIIVFDKNPKRGHETKGKIQSEDATQHSRTPPF